MINWMYFPQNAEIESHLKKIIKIFETQQNEIDSDSKNLKSDEVLSFVLEGLEDLGYKVEKAKNNKDKISVPVLYEKNGIIGLKFEVDAYSSDTKTVIEVEAGRAVANYQFLKDFYEACMMQNVNYFCVAVRNTYRNKKDFDKVCDFFRTLFISNKIQISLKGILVIGY